MTLFPNEFMFEDLILTDIDYLSYFESMDSEKQNPEPQTPEELNIDWQFNEEFQPLAGFTASSEDKPSKMVDSCDYTALTEALLLSEEGQVNVSNLNNFELSSPGCSYSLIPATVHQDSEDEVSHSPIVPIKQEKMTPTHPATTVSTARKRKSTITVKSEIKKKPHETGKQALRRVKNNIASKEFRSRRKNKHGEMSMRIDELITENEALRKDLESVEELVRILKEGMISHARSSVAANK